MAVSRDKLPDSEGSFFDLDIVDTNKDGEVTAVAVTIRGINGSRSNLGRRARRTEYRLLVDVSDLSSGLPEGWIVSPQASQIEHANIWPAAVTCPLTSSRMPRICWGKGHGHWRGISPDNRTLSRFLDLACDVLGDVNVLSPAR